MTYVEQWYERRPPRTSAPYPNNWRDRIVLALLFGGSFLAFVLLIIGLVVAVHAFGALIQILRGVL